MMAIISMLAISLDIFDVWTHLYHAGPSDSHSKYSRPIYYIWSQHFGLI